MKSRITILAIFLFLAMPLLKAQTNKFYSTTGMEMIFSWASIEDNGTEKSSTMRWAPVFNIQSMINYDPSEYFGLYSGIGVRNVGFIYDGYTDLETGDVVKKKFRNYNLGIPIGIKVGNVDKLFFYGGYEVEFPFVYKEKTFKNEVKNKFTVWFSNRVTSVYHTVLVGVQFPYGLNLKFKYYLNNFHNKDYTETKNGEQYKPYENLNANVFYFSLCFNLFKNKNVYYKEEKKNYNYGAL